MEMGEKGEKGVPLVEEGYTPIDSPEARRNETWEEMPSPSAGLPRYLRARIEVDVCDWGKPEFGFRPQKYIDLLSAFERGVESAYNDEIEIVKKPRGKIVGA